MIRNVLFFCLMAIVHCVPRPVYTDNKVHTEVRIEKHGKDSHGDYGKDKTPVYHLAKVHTHQTGYAQHHDGPHDGYGHPHEQHHGPAKYDFSYGIHDDYHGTNFGHSESRDGYHTKGQYYVHLPDGRLQTVSYYVDEYGYHPTITYEGKAHFPDHHGHHGHH